MVHPHLISAILNEPWAISEESALAFSQILSNIFNPNIAFEPGTPTLPSLHAVASPAAATPAKAGMVSGGPATYQIQVINITGPLMKHDQYCGPAGMKSMGQWIQDADRNPDIDGILLVIDTPGGTVSGTEELGAIIKGTKKPILAFGEDLVASAGFWIACNADEVWANNTTAQFGSIGVLMSFMDVQPALEKQGVVFHMITAPQSTEKTSMYDKLRSGDYEEYKTTVLKPLAAKFIDTVKSNRPGVTDEHTTGRVFFAQDVVGSLVDHIGTFNQALQRVAELVDEANPSAIINPTNTPMSKINLDRLARAAAVDAFESADGSISLTADQATAVEAAFEAAETAQAELQSQLDAAATNAARITELEGQLQTANERITELSGEPGAKSATVVVETDANSGAASATGDFYDRFSSLSQSLKSK